MWPWRLNAPKRTVLWLKLLGISVLLHMVALFLILVTYKGYYAQLNIDIKHNSDVPVVFMPLHKSLCVGGVRGGKTGKTKGLHGQSNGRGKGRVGSSQAGTSQKEVHNSAASASSPLPAASMNKSPTTLSSDTKKKNSAPKNNTKKSLPEKRKKQKAHNKQASSKKKVSKKEKVHNKEAPKKKKDAVTRKQAPKPIPEVKQKEVVPEPDRKMVVKKPHEEPVVAQPMPAQDAAGLPVMVPTAAYNDGGASAGDVAAMPGEDGVLYVGQVEWEALQMQEHIQQEIEQHWSPPVGLAHDLVCQIAVVVGWHGEIKEVTVGTPSGVLTYDIYARNAVLAMNFPKAAWGKELILHFKQ